MRVRDWWTLRPLRLPDHRIDPVPAAAPPTPSDSDCGIRPLIVADTIAEIDQRSRGTYGRKRVRAALLTDCDLDVNHKLLHSVMTEHGLYGLPRPGRPTPDLIGYSQNWRVPPSVWPRHWATDQRCAQQCGRRSVSWHGSNALILATLTACLAAVAAPYSNADKSGNARTFTV